MEGTGRYGRGTTLLLALRLAPEIGTHRRRLATRRHFIGVNRHACWWWGEGLPGRREVN